MEHGAVLHGSAHIPAGLFHFLDGLAVGAAVQEGIDGLHFAPGNAAALADAVRKLQNVGETFDLTAMQQKACQAYNAEQNYHELMTIYREIMRNENS